MPRLSLYRPEKTQDYKFIDRTIYEMFQAGGVDVYVHKYIGTQDGDQIKGITQIQDLIFLENRDRKYDQDITILRGHYQTQDIDFNLSQFGLFLQNDTVFLTIHINNSVDLLGRKIIAGDVIELPNLLDEYALNDYKTALKRFYVVEDVNRAAEGFSATWYPHLYRVKLKPIVDSQEFKDILDRPEDQDSYAGEFDSSKKYYPGQIVKYKGNLYVVKESVGNEGTSMSPPNLSYWDPYSENTIADILSTYEKEMQINDGIVAEAENDAPLSGFETSHFYTLAVDPVTGKAAVNTVDVTNTDISGSYDISDTNSPPVRDGYRGYLLEDGIPPNGPLSGSNAQFGFGIQFPKSPFVGDTFLRTDYLPNRMFRFDGVRWVKQEDNVRMTLTNTDPSATSLGRQTLKTSFINNTETSGIDKIASDIILIEEDGSTQFETSDITASFTLSNNSAYVLTNIGYDKKYKVEVWLDENSKATSITISDAGGSLAFTINHHIEPGTRIRYTIYDNVIEQRQAITKALRKIKPVADG